MSVRIRFKLSLPTSIPSPVLHTLMHLYGLFIVVGVGMRVHTELHSWSSIKHLKLHVPAEYTAAAQIPRGR
ncbi:hypothetical protein B0H14DRAFT_3520287 [Mycena olivaceomarginata]|nr:hypothetical protein B0H14DRAFT_3520287 [Mycena olivaceomarginata]